MKIQIATLTRILHVKRSKTVATVEIEKKGMWIVCKTKTEKQHYNTFGTSTLQKWTVTSMARAVAWFFSRVRLFTLGASD